MLIQLLLLSALVATLCRRTSELASPRAGRGSGRAGAWRARQMVDLEDVVVTRHRRWQPIFERPDTAVKEFGADFGKP